MSREEIPVIVVCVLVGVGLVLYAFFRLLRYRRISNPLPPIQELAHHRELQVRQLEAERHVSYTGSQSTRRSLLGSPPSATSGSRSRPTSFLNDSANDTAEDIPNLALRVPVAHDAEPLGLPNPPFRAPSTSNSPSRSSSSTEVESLARSASPSNEGTERSLTPSSPGASMSKQKRYSTTASKSSRLRPHSMLSSSPSYRSMHSTRTARIPHARDSNIQIILPAPLAPDVYQNMGGTNPGITRSNSQISLADKWTASLHRSTSSFTASQIDLSLSRQTPSPTSRRSADSVIRSFPAPPVPPKGVTAPSAWRAGSELERGRRSRPNSADYPKTAQSRSGSKTDTNRRPLRKTRSQVEPPATQSPTVESPASAAESSTIGSSSEATVAESPAPKSPATADPPALPDK